MLPCVACRSNTKILAVEIYFLKLDGQHFFFKLIAGVVYYGQCCGAGSGTFWSEPEPVKIGPALQH